MPQYNQLLLPQDDLEQLPSQNNFYSKFNTGCASCAEDSGVTELKDALDDHTSTQGYTDKVVSAWCCMSKIKDSSISHNEWCYSLYYWIGDFLFRNSTDGNFVAGMIPSICKNVKVTYKKEGCEIICDPVERNLFLHRKVIFDYIYDYTTLKGLISKSGTECTKKYGTYMNCIVTAYNALTEYCNKPTNNNDPYCEEFKSKFHGSESNNIPKPSTLKCSTVQEGGHGTHQADTLTSPGSSNITTITSTIIPIVGLPFVSFFLYKVTIIKHLISAYTSLPFWFRNQFGNNNNSGGRNTRKRSAGPNFSTFTEDDSSTEVSTVYESTEASTSDLTENSSLCTSPSSISTRKGKGTNNRHGRNIRYQAM
ncbi:Variable surface protein Vir7-like [Plasmodium coatneyi]|uniref:Variable surface protein Vir7-like n=1 Tax=Plasmodium coatneyi TaxID=208452 RepID=A0A1B1DSD6_9APIC|nr:Variable surface protein Vir7-like [Plasmodium coatneyi]ANQ05698.1 Variable surface protein Vir7-like [Plasmodium coatneyi]